MADFETTVYQGQDKTEVWAAAIVEYYTESVKILSSIEEFMEYCFDLADDMIIKFHNLKFDGSFILYHLMTYLSKRGYKSAYNKETNKFLPRNEMPSKSFSYLISTQGQWYQITVKNRRQTIIIQDSLKLLPFSVEQIGEEFGTKHHKLKMAYEGYRYPGCKITPAERRYIENDVLVVKEALEIMESEGHTKMTIGSCCMEEFKKTMDVEDYIRRFPNMYDIQLDESWNAPNVGTYIRRSYKGGWCYLVSGKESFVYKHGMTFDVNSLYPSMMHSISGNYYPVGEPMYWKGDYIPDKLINNNDNYCNFYYFIRIKTRFRLKEGYVPCIQIKGNKHYKATRWIETSDIEYDGKYYESIIDREGNVIPTTVTLTLTCVDYELIKKHYNLIDCEILDGIYFYSDIGIFDEYINKYAEIKKNSKGAKRALAKLFLNNLYGKFATSTDSSFKVAIINEHGALSFVHVLENDKNPGYIPVGSAITSYSRRFTITAAQNNYYGVNKDGFIYADTDSIHINCKYVDGIKIDPSELCCWKHESDWEEGVFVRQKTYIEKIDGKYDIKCAGMPDNCKKLLNYSLTGTKPTEAEIAENNYIDEQLEFIKHKRTLRDFKPGLKIFGKLMPKQMKGGTLLVPGYFEIRGKL